MRLSLLSLSAALLACTHAVTTAFAYDWEIDFSVSDQESADNYTYEGSFRYFFAPLEPSSNAPWAETDWVDRLSFVEGSGFHSEQEVDFPGFPGLEGFEIKNKSTSLGTKYQYRKANSRHAFFASIEATELDLTEVQSTVRWTVWETAENGVIRYVPSDSVTTYSRTQRNFTWEVGYEFYLQDLWTVGLNAELNELPYVDSYTYSLSTNKLWKVGNKQWLGVKASADLNETKTVNLKFDTWTYHLEGRFYFTPQTGFSAGTSIPEENLYDAYYLGLHHYFSNGFFLDAQVSFLDFDFPLVVLPDGNTPDLSFTDYNLRIGLRF